MNKTSYCYRRFPMILKRMLIILILAFLMPNTLFAQPCLPDGITFTTQSQIDNFQSNYPGCTIIEGSMKISGNDITNLNGLNVLTSCWGEINIFSNENLTDLTGLSGLTSIPHNFTISYNDNLSSLEGIDNLETIGHMLSISHNGSLTSLEGMNSVSYIGGHTLFHDLPIEDFMGLGNLNHMNSSIIIANCNNLKNLNGLEMLDTIMGGMSIDNCDSLITFEGVDNLIYVGGLTLLHNPSLMNCIGMENLAHIDGGLSIIDCNSISSLSGFDSLVSIGGNLSINENNSLQTLSGIDNIQAESIMNLSITYNPQLSTCEVQSVCDYLAIPNGDIQIYVNATGCNNSVEVEEACTVGLPESPSEPDLSTYPNPFTTSTTIEYELKEPSLVQLTIYKAIGEVVYRTEDRMMLKGSHTVTWSPSHLPEGMYYGVLRSGEGVSVVKMVKQ